MKISVMMPQLTVDGQPAPFSATLDFAQLLDRLGYHMVTFGHHSFTPEIGDPSAPFVVLGALASVTDNIRLGTGIYLSALHHPVTIMEQAATLDQISGGRAVLGVGLGYRDYEYRGFGIAYADRAARLEESLQLMTTAWRTGRQGFDGKFFTVPDLPLHPPCVQQPHVPILVGGSAPAAIDRAARLGTGWFALPQEGLPQMQQQVQLYRDACTKAGTKPYVVLMRHGWIANTMEQAEAEWLYAMFGFHKAFSSARDPNALPDPVIDRILAGEWVGFADYVAGRAIAGTPDMCRTELKRWQDAVQPDEVSLIFGGSTDQAVLSRVVEQFATWVMT